MNSGYSAAFEPLMYRCSFGRSSVSPKSLIQDSPAGHSLQLRALITGLAQLSLTRNVKFVLNVGKLNEALAKPIVRDLPSASLVLKCYQQPLVR